VLLHLYHVNLIALMMMMMMMMICTQVFPWAPTVDGNFLIDTPYNMLKTGRFQKKDALLGVNRDEGTFWILFALPGFSKDGQSPQNRSMFNEGVNTIAWDLNADQVRSMANQKCKRIRRRTQETSKIEYHKNENIVVYVFICIFNVRCSVVSRLTTSEDVGRVEIICGRSTA